MEEMVPSAEQPFEIISDASKWRIASFGKRFGTPHLYLAYHAAFPLALTPDLLYRLWANFQRDIFGRMLNIPWISVTDLLLSRLCNEVGYELYEMDSAVRSILLDHLKAIPNFGEQRIKELSYFLLAYIRQQLDSHDPDVRDFAYTQRWVALSYVGPDVAARELALAFHSSLVKNDKPEQVRMISLIETFAESLEKFTPLLIEYARGMKYLLHGDMARATGQFSKIFEQEPFVQIQDIRLPVPRQMLQSIKKTQGQEIIAVETGPFPDARVMVRDSLLNYQDSLGDQIKRSDALLQTVAAYQAALTISTREYTPDQWALIQNNLGITLCDLARLFDAKASVKKLHEAIACFDAALTVFTREKAPFEWAITQSNKGNGLRDLAEISDGVAKANVLQRSIDCYKAILTVYTRDGLPFDWAKTQYNLGLTYNIFPVGDREANLEQAIAYLRESLHVFTRDAYPVDYAMAQSSLGNIYCTRIAGKRQTNLEQAILLYQNALEIFTRETFPMQWATTQINLGKAYQMRIMGKWQDNLSRAVVCYNAALQIYTKDAFPDQWSRIESSLNELKKTYEVLPADDRLAYLLATDTEQYFSLLYERYYSDIYSYILRLTGNNYSDVEDIVQDTMLKIYSSLHNPSSTLKMREIKLKSWLYSIAHIEVTSYLRKSESRTISLEAFYEMNNISFSNIEANRSEQPEEIIERKEDTQTINELLYNLPPNYRKSIQLYIQGFSTKEIALELRLAEGTIRTYISVGRTELRRAFHAKEVYEY